jgi:hypothetical protein
MPRLGLFKAAAAGVAGALGASLAGTLGEQKAQAAATTASNFAAYGSDTTFTGDPGTGFDASELNSGLDYGVDAYGKKIGVVGLAGDLKAGTFSAGVLGLATSGHLPGGVPFKTGTGVFAWAAHGGVGVDAYGSGGIGVHGTTRSDDKPGILAQNNAAGPGIYGTSANGRGGVFDGSQAAIRLVPSSHPSHPRNGEVGDLVLDAAHRLWFCKRGGNPAVWKRLA